MEEEQRKKKLEAGKERLAAFRKKKAKKKKKPTNGDDVSSQQGADGNLADASSCSDVQSLTGDSDQGSVGSYTSGDEWSAEEADLHSAVYYQTKLVDASRRVSELEEMVEGKQMALDKVVKENTQLREQQNIGSVEVGSSLEDLPRSQSDTMVNTSDLRSALAQRDQIIQQLTTRLRATAEKTTQDYTQETQTLAQQVALLQQQLQQAGETLHGQLNQHNVSSQALQEAKAQILTLQNLLREKEEVLVQLTLQVTQKSEEINRLELLCQEQQEKEQNLEAVVKEHVTKTKDLESSVCQFQTKTKELESYVEKYEVREKELVLCIQQHETREKELEVCVNQCASNETTLQEAIVRLEGQLSCAIKEKEVVMLSIESSGQDEQQKIAKLTLELQTLVQENDRVVTDLDKVKRRNSELENLYNKMEELQSECSLKQSENDELRNKINDQQGETLALKSQLELLLQDGENTGHELDVLKELMETKDKMHDVELQEKTSFISKLESDVRNLEEERKTFVTTIETLNSQILSLQSDLNSSKNETVSYRDQAQLLRVELKKLGRDADNGDKLDGKATDDVDRADAFAIEAEFEVRRVDATNPKSLKLERTVGDSVTLSEKEMARNVDSEVSQKILEERVVKTEAVHSLGSSAVVGDEGSIAKPDGSEANSKLALLSEEISALKRICKENLDVISKLENENSLLQTELEHVRVEVDESTTRVNELETQNHILVNNQQESEQAINSLSSELQSTCVKLRESDDKCETVSTELIYQVRENSSLVAKLETVINEMKVIQTKLTETETALRDLEQESSTVKADLEKNCSDYKNQLKTLQESVLQQKLGGCKEDAEEISRLQKQLAETKLGLEEVTLGAEKTQEDLQNQCDQYASEASELQAELAKAQQVMSHSKDQISTLEEKCNILSHEISSLQKELVTTKEDLSHSQANQAKEQELYSVLKGEDEEHVKEILQLQKKLESTEDEKCQQEEKAKSLQDEISRLSEELEKTSITLRSNLEETTALKQQLDSQLAGSSEAKGALEKEKLMIQQLKHDLKESESQKEILSDEVLSIQQQLLSACSETKKLNLQSHQNDQQMKLLQIQCMSLEENIVELKSESENQQKQYVSQEEATRKLQTELEDTQKQFDKLKNDFDAGCETWKSDLDEKDADVLQLKNDLIAIKMSAEDNDKENERLLHQLKEENLKYQDEIKQLREQQLSAQEHAQTLSLQLGKGDEIIASKQTELEQIRAKLEELTLGAEQSQTELQVKCADQAAEIAKLVSEKTQLVKECEEVRANAETEKIKLQTKIEHLQTESGSLQSDLQQLKSEHSKTLEEEQNVTSVMKSQLDVAWSEAKELQKTLDIANKDLMDTKNEMEKLQSDFEIQLQGYLANIEELKNETRVTKSEIDQLSTKLQCEQDTKTEMQTLYEKSLVEIQRLQSDIRVSETDLEDAQSKARTSSEMLDIEQAARMELQLQFESISSEFYRVNSSEKKIQKDIANNLQRVKLLVGLTAVSVDHPQETSFTNLGDGLNVLEESLSKMKLHLEDQISKRESLTEEISELKSVNSDLNIRLATLTEYEENMKSEIEELKTALESSELQMTATSVDIKTYQTKIESLQQEKEILKVNFDSCMEDMQQKLSDQENQCRSLQSKLMETAKDKDRDDNEIKKMYEDHVTQLEDKLLRMEGELTQAKKTASEYDDTKMLVQESYESKIAEMEEKLSNLESEKTKLQEQQSTFSENFQQEKEDIKSVFETQISELEENCKSLETTMLRLQDQLSEATKTHEQEKEQLEQNFDIQLSEIEDKCRVLELTNGKLKRQMDEMASDFKTEKEDLQKMYESQILDLEDRCSHSELTANKSLQHVTDISKDFGDERETYELRIQDLEERCFELEKTKDDALDRLELVTESAQQERRSLQESMSGQLSDLRKQHTLMETEYAALKDVLAEREQTNKVEMETLKSEYQVKITRLEEKCLQLSTQIAEKMQAEEKIQLDSLQSLSLTVDDIANMKEKNEKYKVDIEQLTSQKGELESCLKSKEDHLKEITEKFEELEGKFKSEICSDQKETDETVSSADESKNIKEMKDKIHSLKSKLASSNQELSKERQRLKASKLAVEKLKKELQNQKTMSDEEIQSLKTKLEAWEVELIQRREFVEQEKGTADSDHNKHTEELKNLVKNYEQRIEALTQELKDLKSEYDADRAKHLHLDGLSKTNVVVESAVDETLLNPSITGGFEPEPDTPELLDRPPAFPVHHTESTDIPLIQGFQPVEGFMVFENDQPAGELSTNVSGDQNSNIHAESLSSQTSESLISGGGFQPEVDHSTTDTFQPEDAGEFKPEDAGEFKPEDAGEFNPEDAGEFKPEDAGEFKPEDAGEFKPEDAGQFKPEEVIESQSLHPVDSGPHLMTTGTQTEVLDLSSPFESHSESLVTPHMKTDSSVEDIEAIRTQLQHEKDVLEEQYVQKMKKLKVELQYDHDAAMKEYQKEVDRKMQQKLTAMKDEKHQAFIKALRKARKQLEEKHKKEVEKIKQEMLKRDAAPSPELSESDLVKQLHKDNLELQEARDALLQEISHTQQSKGQEETWQSQSEHRSVTSSPKPVHDIESQESESSDRHQSEKFLEELENISQRSASDLPLEWELTVSTDDGVFDRELNDNGVCARHECLEMRKKYQRLCGLCQQAQGESVFIEELSPERNQLSGNGRRQRIDSGELGSDATGSSHVRQEAVNTSQDVSEGDFEESFKDKIQKLEAENIALEKKLCDQLEMFSFEKQQLKERCESLKVNLDMTSSSRQNVEEKLVKQHEMIQSSYSQLSTLGLNLVSVETQTEVSGDSFVNVLPQDHEYVPTSVHEHSLQTTDEVLDTTLSSKQEVHSIATANMSTPKSQKKNIRTELNFGETETGISMVEQSDVSSASSPTDSYCLPSVDHMEHMMFSDSDRSYSPTGRTPVRRKKKEQPIEISFNTKSLVSMKCTEGGSIINQEKIELTGTVNSAGSIVPEDYAKVALEIHHAEMVEEISRLKQELHDAKAKYGQENALLREQVERELIARQLWLEKKVPDDKLIKELPLQTDVIELRKEVEVLKENNKMLMDDNKHLLDQVREKECLMLHFRDKFDTEPLQLEECSHGADTQLLMLQKQRDELVEEIQSFHEEHERLLSVLDARTAMEETLRREKEMLLEKLVQYEDAQSLSTEKHRELEFLKAEQRRLEQLLLLKDENEQQLLKQKRHMEEDMYDIEGKLKEREAFLEEEKHRLLREVKEKNLTILKLETMTRGSEGAQGGPGGPRHESRRASTGHVNSGSQPGSGQAMSLDTSYDEAIEILRNKLRLEYEVKEAELNVQHASDKAAFWKQHNKKVP